MIIKREEHGNRGAFYIADEAGEWIAEMTYRREGTRKIVIDHTEVSDELEGKGIGQQLVKAAVKYARAKNLLIKPECSFAKKILEAGDEYEDVLTR
jgi:predicted GNAT family acetyltransferase